MKSDTLEQLYVASLHLVSSLSLQDTYKTLLKETIKIAGGTHGSIFLNSGGGLKRVYSSVPGRSQIIPRPYGLSYQTFIDGELRIHRANSVRKNFPSVFKQGIRSIMLIPLSYQDQHIGMFSIQCHTARPLSSEKLSMIKLYSAMASLAIRKAKLTEELARALKTRDLFIAMASHELKTPLTAITLSTEMAKKSIEKGRLPDKKIFHLLSSEVLRLNITLSELFELHNVQLGKFNYHMKVCNIIDIIERSIFVLEANYPDRQVIFHHDLLKRTYVFGDFDKLLQAISNILFNAAKFSSSSSVINFYLSKQNDHISLEVHDKGQGIASKDIPRIFDSFYKGDSLKKEGMGLGLFLAKEIITNHHGDITVTSRVKKGTTITIILPLAYYERKRPASSKQRSILE